MPEIQKLRTLTATTETVRRQRDAADRATLTNVAARLWAAWRQCFPSCETLTEEPENWCLLSRSELDQALYLHRSQQCDESWTHPDPMSGSASVIRTETAWRTTVRIEIRTAAQGRLFAVTFEEHRDAGRVPHTGRDAYTLTQVEVDFGADGSFDRAAALAGWYLWPDANGTDGETYEPHELPLLWSAAPEFDQVYVAVDVPSAS